jgi:hypothetical protein
MFTQSTLLALAGGALRLAVTYVVWRRFNILLTVPQFLALGLVGLSCLPDFIKPFPWPLSFGMTLAVFLPDFLFRRR